MSKKANPEFEMKPAEETIPEAPAAETAPDLTEASSAETATNVPIDETTPSEVTTEPVASEPIITEETQTQPDPQPTEVWAIAYEVFRDRQADVFPHCSQLSESEVGLLSAGAAYVEAGNEPRTDFEKCVRETLDWQFRLSQVRV